MLPISKAELLRTFNALLNTSLRPSRMYMTPQDAADLGYYKTCHRCGGLVSPDPGYVHPLDECDESMVRTIMDS